MYFVVSSSSTAKDKNGDKQSLRYLLDNPSQANSKGVVDLHWALMLLPAPIADYVIVHELAHLHELNHSAAFWHLVATVMPDYRQRRAWLKRHGHLFVM
jgi:predicted metal-dependent hydrolase